MKTAKASDGKSALFSPPSAAHIRPMAKPPDSKKSKDPARPTRSKAAREPLAPIAPHLEKLLNPGIAAGTAGLGSGTGLQQPPSTSKERRADFSAAHTARKSVSSTPSTPLPNPPPQGGRERTQSDEGASRHSGFGEAPQATYTSDA